MSSSAFLLHALLVYSSFVLHAPLGLFVRSIGGTLLPFWFRFGGCCHLGSTLVLRCSRSVALRLVLPCLVGFFFVFSASRSSGFGFRFSASRCCGFGLRLFCFTLLWGRFSSFLLQAPAGLVFFPASHSCGFVLLFCSTLLWVCYSFFLPHALVGLVFAFSTSRSCLFLLRLFCFTLL